MFTSSLTLSHHLPFSPLALISPHPCSQSRCPSLPGPPLYSHVSACYSLPTAEQHNPGVLEFSCINLIEYLCLYAPECWLYCIMDVQRHAVLGKLKFFLILSLWPSKKAWMTILCQIIPLNWCTQNIVFPLDTASSTLAGISLLPTGKSPVPKWWILMENKDINSNPSPSEETVAVVSLFSYTIIQKLQFNSSRI